MTKPWEETWTVEGDMIVLPDGDRFDCRIGKGESDARAQLASAAPEMARALLALYMGQEVSAGVIVEALRNAGVILSVDEEAALLDAGKSVPRGPRP